MNKIYDIASPIHKIGDTDKINIW